MTTYVNIWRDRNGMEEAGSVFKSWDDVVEDVRDWCSPKNQYLYTLSDEGIKHVTDEDLTKLQEQVDAEKAHNNSVRRWYGGPRETAY